jgi:Fur family peroxide stress response transcriptional regulator
MDVAATLPIAVNPRPQREREPEEELRAGLEAAGWRFTKQRAAVYRYLRGCESHPTADEVYTAVKRSIASISLATVYKSLETLVSCGLANKLTHADATARYDARRDAHYHLRCTRTGEVHDVPVRFEPALLEKLDPELGARLAAQGFEVTGYRLEVVGYFRPGAQGRGDEE